MPLLDDYIDPKEPQRASSSEPTPEEFQGENVNPDDAQIDPAFGADVSGPGSKKKWIVRATSSSTEKDQTEPLWESNDLAEDDVKDELPENLWADSLSDDAFKAATASAPFEITNLKALLDADFNRTYNNLNLAIEDQRKKQVYKSKQRLLWEALKAGRRDAGNRFDWWGRLIPSTSLLALIVAYRMKDIIDPSMKDFLHGSSHKGLPGKSRYEQSPAEINWNTMDYSHYLQNIDWNALRRINHFKTSLICTFTPDMVNRQTNQFITTIQSPLKNPLGHDTYYLSGANYHNLLYTKTLAIHQTDLMQSAQDLDLACFSGPIPFHHNYFHQHDTLPLKIGDIFATSAAKPYTFTNTGKKPRGPCGLIFRQPKNRHHDFPLGNGYLRRALFPVGDPICVISKTPYLSLPPLPPELTLPPMPSVLQTLTYQETLDRFVHTKLMHYEAPLSENRLIHYQIYDTVDILNQLLKQFVNMKRKTPFNLNNFLIDPRLSNQPAKADQGVSRKSTSILGLEVDPRFVDGPEQNRIELTGNMDKDIRLVLQADVQRSRAKTPRSHLPREAYPKPYPEFKPFTKGAAVFNNLKNTVDFSVLPEFQELLFRHADERLEPFEGVLSKLYLGYRKTPSLRSQRTPRGLLSQQAFQVSNRVLNRIQVGHSKKLKRLMSGYVFPDMAIHQCRMVANYRMDPFLGRCLFKRNQWLQLRIQGPTDVMFSVYSGLIDTGILGRTHYGKGIWYDQGMYYGQAFTDLGYSMGIKPDRRYNRSFFPSAPGLLVEHTNSENEPLYEWQSRPDPIAGEIDEQLALAPYGVEPSHSPSVQKGNIPYAHGPSMQHTCAIKLNFDQVELFGPSIAQGEQGPYVYRFRPYQLTRDDGFEPYNRFLKKNYKRTFYRFKKWVPLAALFVPYMYMLKTHHKLEPWFQTYMTPAQTALREWLYRFDTDALAHLTAQDRLVIEKPNVPLGSIHGGKAYFSQFYLTLFYLRRSKVILTTPKVKRPPDFDGSRPGLPYGRKEGLIKGFLFVGPPGTGKTLLSSALATEVGVPLLVFGRESVLREKDPDSWFRQGGESKRLIQMDHLFNMSRLKSPCIVFIDEIDGLAPLRQNLAPTVFETVRGPGVVYGRNAFREHNSFLYWSRRLVKNPDFDLDRNTFNHWKTNSPQFVNLAYFLKQPNFFYTKILSPYEEDDPAVKELTQDPDPLALRTLTRLLWQLDGVNSREGVVVIGATNRPDALDPALTRPGRLHELVYLDLPHRQRRIELIQFYSENKLMEPIDWDYLAESSLGLSQAHLKAALNFSALRSMYNQLNQVEVEEPSQIVHTMDTIRHGFENVKYSSAGRMDVRFEKACYDLHDRVYPPFMYAGFDMLQNLHFVLTDVLTKADLVYLYQQKGMKILDKMPQDIKTVQVSRIRQAQMPKLEQQRPGKQRPKPTLGKVHLSPEALEIKARRFYARARRKVREVRLLAHVQNQYEAVSTNRLDLESLSSSTQTLIALAKYSRRVFKFHLFGLQLLLNTPCSQYDLACLRPNPLYKKVGRQWIKSDFHFALYPPESVKMRQLLRYATTSMFMDDFCAKSQGALFKDPITLNRAAYYLAGRAMTYHFVDQRPEIMPPYRLWGMLQMGDHFKDPKGELIKELTRECTTRSQYEDYLMLLLAGKAGEQFMLARYERPEQSNMGRDDMKKANWTAKIMVEHNLFYSLGNFSHVAVDGISGDLDIRRAQEYHRTAEANQAARQTQALKKRKPVQRPDEKFIIEHPILLAKKEIGAIRWWQRDLFPANSFSTVRWNSKYSAIRDSIKYVHDQKPDYDVYFTNQMNNGLTLQYLTDFEPPPDLGLGLTDPIDQTDPALASIDPIDTYASDVDPLNTEFGRKFFAMAQINWNQMGFHESQQLITELMHVSFQKLFHLFDINRELIDYLAHSILVHDEMTPAQVENLIFHFTQDTVEMANYIASGVNMTKEFFDGMDTTDPTYHFDPARGSVDDIWIDQPIQNSPFNDIENEVYFDGIDITVRQLDGSMALNDDLFMSSNQDVNQSYNANQTQEERLDDGDRLESCGLFDLEGSNTDRMAYEEDKSNDSCSTPASSSVQDDSKLEDLLTTEETVSYSEWLDESPNQENTQEDTQKNTQEETQEEIQEETQEEMEIQEDIQEDPQANPQANPQEDSSSSDQTMSSTDQIEEEKPGLDSEQTNPPSLTATLKDKIGQLLRFFQDR
jgi:SpoVK/Ycf46/Vps4 family AAA+-type ATPase